MALAAVPGMAAAASPVWSDAHDGIAIRLELDLTGAGAVRVLLRNTGQLKQNVLLGDGHPSYYSLHFEASGPNGSRCEFADVGQFVPMAGLIVPLVARIEPGAVFEARISLHDLICTQPPDYRMDEILRMGFTLKVALDVGAETAAWSGSANEQRWLGRVESPAIGLE